MWMERFARAHGLRGSDAAGSELVFYPGATPPQLQMQCARTRIKWPDDLCSLLLETDGVSMTLDLGAERVDIGWQIFPSKLAAAETIRLAPDVKGLCAEELVFFAPGDDFAFACGAISRQVYCWYPIDGEVLPIAPSVAEFVELATSRRLVHLR